MIIQASPSNSNLSRTTSVPTENRAASATPRTSSPPTVNRVALEGALEGNLDMEEGWLSVSESETSSNASPSPPRLSADTISALHSLNRLGQAGFTAEAVLNSRAAAESQGGNFSLEALADFATAESTPFDSVSATPSEAPAAAPTARPATLSNETISALHSLNRLGQAGFTAEAVLNSRAAAESQGGNFSLEALADFATAESTPFDSVGASAAPPRNSQVNPEVAQALRELNALGQDGVHVSAIVQGLNAGFDLEEIRGVSHHFGGANRVEQSAADREAELSRVRRTFTTGDEQLDQELAVLPAEVAGAHIQLPDFKSVLTLE